MPATHKILVVEDNPLFEQQIGTAIRSLGVGGSVTVCENGADAIAALSARGASFSLVLVDLGLPDMDGTEVIQAARRRFPEVPIMVISVISAETSVLAAIRAGARGYILKGDSASSISHAIQAVLEGNYPISPALARSLFRLAGAPPAHGGGSAFRLSRRETETLEHIARGDSYEEVARRMGVSLSTVQSNIRSLYRKLDVHSQLQAVNKARSAGLI